MPAIDGVRDRLRLSSDQSDDCGTALLVAQAMFEAIRADDAMLLARLRRCEALLAGSP